MMQHSLYFIGTKRYIRELMGSPPTSALKKMPASIDWYQIVWFGMTRNGINAAKLRYFTEFSRQWTGSVIGSETLSAQST